MVTQSSGKNDASSKVLISNLIHLVSSSRLSDLIRQKHVSDVVIETAHALEKSSTNGPLEMVAGGLTIQVQSILGFK